VKIALYSSKRPRCGIATYTNYLEDALRSLGADVRHYGSGVPAEVVFSEVRAWNPEIFHVQHEHAIMPPNETLSNFAQERVQRGRRNIITLHTESQASAALASRGGFQASIIHRMPELLENAHVLPMPCPVQEASTDRGNRPRYGFPADSFIITTLGFMLSWKMMVETAEQFMPWLRENPEAYLQILASEHFSPGSAEYMRKCVRGLAALSVAVGGRIRHVLHYPSDQEVLERLLLSDLGYVYCPFDTKSASAAASLFISARCPLVTSASTHYDHLMCHVIRTPKGDLPSFVKRITEVARDADLLLRLRKSSEILYAETNYLECARRHLSIYGS